jgi:TonB family protein
MYKSDRKSVGAGPGSLLIWATLWITPMTEATGQSIAPPGPLAAPANASTGSRDPSLQECSNLQTIAVGFDTLRRAPLVSVHVKSDGVMRDPMLVESSGDGDFDRAALSCANGHHAGTFADSGIPAETNWVLGYYRHQGGSDFAPASPGGKPAESCEGRLFELPSDKMKPKDTVLSYVIGANGRATNVAVVATSGAPDLDRQAANCVSAWHFFPVFRNGEAIAVEQTFTVKWQVR